MIAAVFFTELSQNLDYLTYYEINSSLDVRGEMLNYKVYCCCCCCYVLTDASLHPVLLQMNGVDMLVSLLQSATMSSDTAKRVCLIDQRICLNDK